MNFEYTRKDQDASKVEYCELIASHRENFVGFQIIIFRVDGNHQVHDSKPVKSDEWENYARKVIAQFGLDGWELLTHEGRFWSFKRLMPRDGVQMMNNSRGFYEKALSLFDSWYKAMREAEHRENYKKHGVVTYSFTQTGGLIDALHFAQEELGGNITGAWEPGFDLGEPIRRLEYILRGRISALKGTITQIEFYITVKKESKGLFKRGTSEDIEEILEYFKGLLLGTEKCHKAVLGLLREAGELRSDQDWQQKQ